MSVIPSDKVIDIYLQVVLGVEGPENEAPRLAEFREQLTREVKKLKEQGVQLDIPGEHDPGV